MNNFFKISLSIFILLPFACAEKSEASKLLISENHKIISTVIDSIAAYESPRSLWPSSPPQNQFKKTLTRKDSLKAREGNIKYINLFRTIAIDTSLALYLPDYETSEKIIDTKDYDAITRGYDSIQEIRIDINSIKLRKVKNTIYYDSITYLNPSKHITKYRSYKGIDYRFNFSKIFYNENKTRAIIRYQYRFEDRYPEGGLFLLTKENEEWKIVNGHRFMSY